MANDIPPQKLSDLTTATNPGNADLLYIVQGGVSKKLPMSFLDSRVQSMIAAQASGRNNSEFDVHAYGATGLGIIDDTPFIQDAMNACAEAGGGTVLFRLGCVYRLAGDLQDVDGANAQLVLPSLDLHNTQQIVITLRGVSMASPIPIDMPSSYTYNLTTKASVLKSVIAGSVGGSVLGISGPGNSWSNVTIRLENLVFRLPTNPVLTAANFNLSMGLEVKDTLFDTGQWDVLGITEPMTSTSFALKTPSNNNGAYTYIHGLTVIGYYNGLESNEHVNGDQISFWGCKNGLVFQAGYHASYFSRVLAVAVQNIITVLGESRFQIAQLDIEHYNASVYGSSWLATVYDVLDTGNHGYGKIVWHVVLGSYGVDNTFTKSGGLNVSCQRIGNEQQGSESSAIVGMCDPTTAIGDMIYRDTLSTGQTLGVNQATAALGATAAMDSMQSGGNYPAINAIDGDDDTFAYLGNGVVGHWISIDLGSIKTIRGHRLFTFPEVDNKATIYKIQTSVNGISWTDFRTVSPQADDDTVVWSSAIASRYFRFVALATNGVLVTPGGYYGWGWAIKSIELYSDGLNPPVALPIGNVGDVITATLIDGKLLPRWAAPTGGGISTSVSDSEVTYVEASISQPPTYAELVIALGEPSIIGRSLFYLRKTGTEIVYFVICDADTFRFTPLVTSYGPDTTETPPAGSGTLIPLDGGSGWCWFNDPRAIYYNGHTFYSVIDSSGNIQVRKYTHSSNTIDSGANVRTGFTVDDHNNPALLLRYSDKRLMCFYAGHVQSYIYYKIATNPEDETTWGAEINLASQIGTGGLFTYPTPMQLLQEPNDPIYLFFRQHDTAQATDANWWYTKSENDGNTWSPGVNVVRQTYAKIVSNDQNRIDFAVCDHPDAGPNGIYHFYYQGGHYYKSNGTLITASMPFQKTDLTQVYDGSTNYAWIWDIALDASGKPTIVFANFHSTTDHRYQYAHWNGASWDVHEICTAGTYIALNLTADPGMVYYSGGVFLDHNDPQIVYASRQVSGQWEIWRYTTADGGTTFTHLALTSSSPHVNVRPISVYHHAPTGLRTLWMRGSDSVEYSDYYHIDTIVYGTDL